MEGSTLVIFAGVVLLANTITNAAFVIHRRNPDAQLTFGDQTGPADDSASSLSNSFTKEFPAYLSENNRKGLIQLLKSELGFDEEVKRADEISTQKRPWNGWSWVRGDGEMEPRQTRERSGWGGGYGKRNGFAGGWGGGYGKRNGFAGGWGGGYGKRNGFAGGWGGGYGKRSGWDGGYGK